MLNLNSLFQKEIRDTFILKVNDGKRIFTDTILVTGVLNVDNASVILEENEHDLYKIIDLKIERCGIARLIVCHFVTRQDLTTSPAHVIISRSEFHTPQYIVDRISIIFKNSGFGIIINPLDTTFGIPSKFLHCENKLEFIQLELNSTIEGFQSLKLQALGILNTIMNG